MLHTFAPSRDETRALMLWDALSRCHAGLMRGLSKRLAPHHLTQPQFDVLELLLRKGAMPLNEIGRQLQVSAANITCVVVNLEKAGLVARSRSSEDRRVYLAALTPEGRARSQEVLPAYAGSVEEMTADLTPDEQEILLRLLKKLQTNL